MSLFLPSPAHARKLCVLVLIIGRTALAGDAGDPLATATLAPPRPALLGGVESPTPCTATVGTTALSLVEIVDLALCNNPRTREVWANARAQAAQVGVAQAAWLPSLDARAGIDRDWNNGSGQSSVGASLSLSWMLHDFGARDANLENARQLLAAAAATQDDTVQAVFLAAVQAYYAVQATAAAVVAAQESERASRVAFTAAEARYRVGSGTPADRLQAQTALSQATLNRIRAEGEARNARGGLAATLGRDAQQTVNIVAASLPNPSESENFDQDLDALVAAARRRRPDLRAAEAQVRAAEASVTAARAAGRPSIALGASANRTNVNGGGDSHGGTLGVTVNIPLFSGYATTYRVRAAEAQAEARAAQRERVRIQVALDVWNGVQNLVTASAALRSSADLLASAEQSERVALGRYQAGVGNIIDTLNAQSALASARQQSVQAGYNWNVARATLAQAMGGLDLDLLGKLADAPAAGSAATTGPVPALPAAKE